MSTLSSWQPTKTVRILATIQNLDSVHTTLAQFWYLCDTCPDPPRNGAWRSAFNTAVGEIGANIVRHAYAGLPPAPMSMRLRLEKHNVIACFADAGHPYNASHSAKTLSDLNDILSLPESGMGLMIAAAALDTLRYRRICSVNIWQLIKCYTSHE